MDYYRRRRYTPFGCIIGAIVGIGLFVTSIVVVIVIMLVMFGSNSSSSAGEGAPGTQSTAASAISDMRVAGLPL